MMGRPCASWLLAVFGRQLPKIALNLKSVGLPVRALAPAVALRIAPTRTGLYLCEV
jgi:hypothetical protein